MPSASDPSRRHTPRGRIDVPDQAPWFVANFNDPRTDAPNALVLRPVPAGRAPPSARRLPARRAASWDRRRAEGTPWRLSARFEALRLVPRDAGRFPRRAPVGRVQRPVSRETVVGGTSSPVVSHSLVSRPGTGSRTNSPLRHALAALTPDAEPSSAHGETDLRTRDPRTPCERMIG